MSLSLYVASLAFIAVTAARYLYPLAPSWASRWVSGASPDEPPTPPDLSPAEFLADIEVAVRRSAQESRIP